MDAGEGHVEPVGDVLPRRLGGEGFTPPPLSNAVDELVLLPADDVKEPVDISRREVDSECLASSSSLGA